MLEILMVLGHWFYQFKYAEIVSTLALVTAGSSFVISFLANKKTNEGIYIQFGMAYYTHENMREYLQITITNTANRPVLISSVSLNLRLKNGTWAGLAYFDVVGKATPFTLGAGAAEVLTYPTERGQLNQFDFAKTAHDNLSVAIDNRAVKLSVEWGARRKRTEKLITMKKV
jgi:hypothetical protein